MADQSRQPKPSPAESNEGNTPATDAQIVYLDTLTAQVGEAAPAGDITKNDATKIIEELRQETGIDDVADTASEDIVSLHRDQ